MRAPVLTATARAWGWDTHPPARVRCVTARPSASTSSAAGRSSSRRSRSPRRPGTPCSTRARPLPHNPLSCNGPWYKPIYGRAQGDRMGEQRAYGHGSYADKKIRGQEDALQEVVRQRAQEHADRQPRALAARPDASREQPVCPMVCPAPRCPLRSSFCWAETEEARGALTAPLRPCPGPFPPSPIPPLPFF